MPPNPTALAPVARYRPDAGRDRSTAAVRPGPRRSLAVPPRRSPPADRHGHAAATHTRRGYRPDRTDGSGRRRDDGGQS